MIGNTPFALPSSAQAQRSCPAIVNDDPRLPPGRPRTPDSPPITGARVTLLAVARSWRGSGPTRPAHVHHAYGPAGFQSALLDENTTVVVLWRSPARRRPGPARVQTGRVRRAEGHGDRISCHQCVAVCPAGIGIPQWGRWNALSTAPLRIDASDDDVMDRIGRPRGLVRYASPNGIQRGEPLRCTARMKLVYTRVLGPPRSRCSSSAPLQIAVPGRADRMLPARAGSLSPGGGEGHQQLSTRSASSVNKTRGDLPDRVSASRTIPPA